MIMTERKKLKIVDADGSHHPHNGKGYCDMLNALLIAESNLIKAKQDSGMPHFIAIVKELEQIHGFKFVPLEEEEENEED